jgi:HEAT repeat protein
MSPKKNLSKTDPDTVDMPEGKKSEEIKSQIETLISELSSHNDSTRRKARYALVGMGETAIPSLIEILRNRDTHPLIRWEAAKALGEIADPKTAPVLVEYLEDEDFDIRWLAAEGLIKLNISALQPLLRALEKPGCSIRLQEGAHHVFHDLAKGALRKYLAPVLAALEKLEPGERVPWVAPHDMAVEVPWAARQALELLEKKKKP